MTPTSCKHYNGDYHNKTCRAGVCYRDVTTRPDDNLGRAFRKPCVDWEAFNNLKGTTLSPSQKEEWKERGKCDKFELPTVAELKAEDEAMQIFADQVDVARKIIVEELKRRYAAKDAGVSAVSPNDEHRWYKPQSNYFHGSGIMDCPICKKGKLHYQRASHNGHIRARCSTPSCVGWIE